MNGIFLFLGKSDIFTQKSYWFLYVDLCWYFVEMGYYHISEFSDEVFRVSQVWYCFVCNHWLHFLFICFGFSSFAFLAMTLSILLYNSKETLIPGFSGTVFISFSDVYRCVVYSLFYAEACSFYYRFLWGFYYERQLNFVTRFSALTEMIMWLLSLSLLICCIGQILGMKPTHSWCMIF